MQTRVVRQVSGSVPSARDLSRLPSSAQTPFIPTNKPAAYIPPQKRRRDDCAPQAERNWKRLNTLERSVLANVPFLGRDWRAHPQPQIPPLQSSSKPPSSATTVNWRSNRAAPKAVASKVADLDTIEIGLICQMPANPSDVPRDAEIHGHPDFIKKADGLGNITDKLEAWGHPCVIISINQNTGLAMCAQLTSFSNAGGSITGKYIDRPDRVYGEERRRWLLCEHPGGPAPHDGLPVLKTDHALKKASYINCNKYFFIEPRYLNIYWNKSKEMVCLSGESVDAIQSHHDRYFELDD
jgi:hypothetical protein